MLPATLPSTQVQSVRVRSIVHVTHVGHLGRERGRRRYFPMVTIDAQISFVRVIKLAQFGIAAGAEPKVGHGIELRLCYPFRNRVFSFI